MSEDQDRSMEMINMLKAKSEEIAILKLQNDGFRTALEIALPSMVHTFSGHDDPSVWVDGCGKCRVSRLLTNQDLDPLKRSVSGPKDDPCTRCGYPRGSVSHGFHCLKAE